MGHVVTSWWQRGGKVVRDEGIRMKTFWASNSGTSQANTKMALFPSLCRLWIGGELSMEMRYGAARCEPGPEVV